MMVAIYFVVTLEIFYTFRLQSRTSVKCRNF